MAKGFSKNNPLEKLSGVTQTPVTDISDGTSLATVETNQVEHEVIQDKPQVVQKRKVGRPKTKNVKNTCRNINVAIPISLLDQWEDIKMVHSSNLTGYITKLIEKDMAANYEQYKNITNSLKNI